MADDRPQEAGFQAGSGEKPEAQSEDAALSPDSSRARRAPPTIDLDASEVSSETRNAAGEGAPQEPQPEEVVTAEAPAAASSAAIAPPISAPISPWVIAPVSGAVAAALVIGVGWMLGWPAVQPAAAPPAVQLNAAAIDGLTGRVASLEFCLPRGIWLPLWRLYTRVGLPALGRLDSRGWFEAGRFLGPSIEGFYRSYPLTRQVDLWRAAGIGAIEIGRAHV